MEKRSTIIDDPLFARCIVLADSDETLALVIVDSCMVPRDLCDSVKQSVDERIGIPTDHLLIAATHTHSAPSVMDYCLGTSRDEVYAEFLVARLVEGIVAAHGNLQPAQAGWATTDAPHHTHSRRWLRQPGSVAADPFGDPTVRAMMHPGYQNPEYAGPAGPVDSQLSVLSIQSTAGDSLCLLANYSMHYFGGANGFSADYFGDYCRYLEAQYATPSARQDRSPFVAIMSQGTSGDLHWMDYSQPKRASYRRERYAAELGEITTQLVAGIVHRDEVDLAMAETKLTLERRLPTPRRLAWAKQISRERGDRRPQNRPEVYAEQAEWIAANPTAELVLQAVRIGDMAIAAMPNEVYAVTGLKLKAQSPLQPLFNMELANGAEGYIPPKEQHFLGGYTTWPARTAGLEVAAEQRIVDEVLGLLERVSPAGQRRPLETDLYTAEQHRAIQQANVADNNRTNRGASDR